MGKLKLESGGSSAAKNPLFEKIILKVTYEFLICPPMYMFKKNCQNFKSSGQFCRLTNKEQKTRIQNVS